MSRIQDCFARLGEQQRKALIPYITAGDPTLEVTVPAMHAMVEAGADVIELGVPFSDPMADGPVIQKACERALRAGTSLTRVLEMVGQFRRDNDTTPVVLMGYLNPVEIMGYARFADACVAAGVDGVLLVDLPPEECEDVAPLFRERGIDLIFLIAPTTTDARIRSIAAAASGYLYYVSVKGVTGSASLDVNEVAARVETIRNLAQLPIGVGFGIKDAQSAQAVSRVSDGVVVGSVLVSQAAEHEQHPEKIAPAMAAILADMRAAMDKP
ncbi:tryptophan synthase subunit alpha [Alloalcanivorax mobilis]|uniref:tryptophan synthase subunit alpha n=1 Tax=Alloalcanivorax mobilis TaxID=2019569 RepID=UPI000B5B2CEF|nr:tryptophan synthase subunit alpha [Alloalcanivorax mobilis]ASK33998.1 tryptophan synthase subunit alpha [Alcanivorax sp. N3-2A]|tara:strand:+ start:2835 stop:3641 length:807 start_codon:yes stop_codon:yes gene_type:complete